MKILHICPTFSKPTCGIGKYTHYLADALKVLGCEQIVAEGFLIIRNTLLQHRPDVVHIQLEYGFCTAHRLNLIEEFCKEVRARLVITYHTLAPMPHNIAARTALKLAHTPLALEYGRFTIIPSGIPLVETTPGTRERLVSKVRRFVAKDGVRRLLFFGQAHPHKQLLETIQEIQKRQDVQLFCIVSRPVQGDPTYYDKCRAQAGADERILWIEQYLEDDEVVLLAKTSCDAAIFPYREYGSVGISAAVRLLLNILDLPIYISDVSHFSDIPTAVLPRSRSIPEMLSCKALPPDLRQFWVEAHRFERVAETHLKLYAD